MKVWNLNLTKIAQKVVPYTCGLFFFLVCENLASASSLARTQGWLFCDNSSWHGVLGKGERGQMLYPSKISRKIKSLHNYFFDLCWCFFLSKTGVTTSILPKCAEMMMLLDNLTKMHSQVSMVHTGKHSSPKKVFKKSLYFAFVRHTGNAIYHICVKDKW